MASTPEPLPHTATAQKVHAALDAYLSANGFTIEGYSAATFRLTILGRSHDFPNPPQRQQAIALHDLHHVATGYGTNFIGEAEIGAWELAAGCTTFIVYLLNFIAVSFGMFLSPLRVLRAARHGLRGRTLYRSGLDREHCLTLDVSELRTRLGIPVQGLSCAAWQPVTKADTQVVSS